jgi:transposase
LAELIVILELHQQGMTVSAIARRTGLHRGTVAKYIARGIEPPIYGPRLPRPTKLAAFERYLRERIAVVPELTGSRLHREIRELGYRGSYTVVKDFLRQVRPRPAPGLRSVSRRHLAVRRKWILPTSARSLPTRRGPSGSSGCSRSCSATAG